MSAVICIDCNENELQLRKNEILRYLGYQKPECDEATDALIISCYEELLGVITPKACFVEGTVECKGDGIIEVCGMVIKSRALEKNLEGCKTGAVFGATLGVGADRLIAKYSCSSPSRSVVINAVAASLIEVLCDEVNRQIVNERISRPRFSAGYGDLSLEAQKQIAELLGLNKNIGVCLTESLMMRPSKSVTAIIGMK